MKKILTIALCALFAIHAAEARTLYVNAKRPNNKGNGLKAKTAKKTIQAAINIAKKGDTILVYPGTYAPIKTNNKKITIKSVKGQKKTKIVPKANTWTVADLAKTEAAGNATMLFGFLLDGTKLGKTREGVTFSWGGTLKSCTAQNFNVKWGGFSNSKLENCLVQNNYLVTGSLFWQCTTKSAKITKNVAAWSFCNESTFVNCLIAGNTNNWDPFAENSTFLRKCTLLNCTVADNTFISGTSFRNNTSVNGTFAGKSKFHNCILWNNLRQEYGNLDQDVGKTVHNVDPGNTYKNTDKTNRNPKFTSAYKLKKGSYAINKGKLTKAQKKLIGKTDLAGKKRIKGKAIDCGCYEY